MSPQKKARSKDSRQARVKKASTRDDNVVSGTVDNGGVVIQGGEGNEYNIQIIKAAESKAEPDILRLPEIPTQRFEPKTILIPEGEFWMGRDAGNDVPEYEMWHKVTLPAYRIGHALVTNRQFEYFIRKMNRQVPLVMGWDGQSIPAGQGDRPVLGVTWDEAKRYCDWLNQETKRNYSLPNEAQWEKACRGTFAGLEFSLNLLEWTCSLWGENLIEPDRDYYYPWKNDDNRNDPGADRRFRRVVRSCMTEDATHQRNCTARMGRSTNDPGNADARHSFRVILVK